MRFAHNNEQEVGHFSVRVSPAEGAVEFINEISGYIGKEDGFDNAHFELRSFNTSSDGIKEKVEVKCNVRIPVGFDIGALKEILKKYPVEISEDSKPVLVDKNNKLVRAFTNSIRDKGGDPRFVKKLGSSDMNIFATKWEGVSMVAYGPDDSKLDHTHNEYIDTDEYLKSIEVLKSVLENLI